MSLAKEARVARRGWKERGRERKEKKTDSFYFSSWVSSVNGRFAGERGRKERGIRKKKRKKKRHQALNRSCYHVPPTRHSASREKKKRGKKREKEKTGEGEI